MKNQGADQKLVALVRSLQVDVNELRNGDPLANLSMLAGTYATQRGVEAQAKDPARFALKPNNGGGIARAASAAAERGTNYSLLMKYINIVAKFGKLADVNKAEDVIKSVKQNVSGFHLACYTSMLYALEARKQELLDNDCPWILKGEPLEMFVEEYLCDICEADQRKDLNIERMGGNRACA